MSGLEPLLWECIRLLSAYMPPSGMILDAGANDGSSTAMLAREFRRHTVVGVEPTRVNVKRALELTAGLQNAVILRGVLSESSGALSYPLGREFRAGVLSQVTGSDLQPTFGRRRNNITAHSVDSLLLERGQALAFAHFDAEGHELSILRGMQRTLSQTRPLFTAEAFPSEKPSERRAFRQLKLFIHSFNYTMHEVRETCGNKGCRNFLCVPAELARVGGIASRCAQGENQRRPVPCLACADSRS